MSMTQEDAWIVNVLGFDPDRLRAQEGGESEGKGPGGFFGDLKKKIMGDKSGPKHPVLGTAQQARADKLMAKLSDTDKAKVQAVIDEAGPKEKGYLTKSLAAGHSVAEIGAFAAKIKGKNDKWLQDNLSLTGSSSGSGVQQQWSHSCNATTVEAVKGELDPIYALKMHEDNPNMGKVDNADATKKNPNLAADQKAMLESTYHGSAAGEHAGVAASRDNAGGTGSGRWASDLLDGMKDITGLTYETKKVGKDVTTDEVITSIEENTAKGNPVPIVIGNKQADYTHYVLVTATDPGPPRLFSIHDPWSGKTVTRTEKQMKNGTLDIAGSNQITAFEKPTQVEVK